MAELRQSKLAAKQDTGNMYLKEPAIHENSMVSDIVKENYRTADVFRKHNIDYCCGGRWPLETLCDAKGIEFNQLKEELEAAGRTIQLSPGLPFHTWSVDFLTSYIINVHHYYLKSTMPVTGEIIKHFADEHKKNVPYMQEVYTLFEKLRKDLLPHLHHEEAIIFPYICQIVHAHENNDSYAKLLVKTLRKPLDIMIQHEHDMLEAPLFKIRELTNNYVMPEGACVSHKVALLRLKELDNDLMQHMYLENKVLFPKALKIEKELLQ